MFFFNAWIEKTCCTWFSRDWFKIHAWKMPFIPTTENLSILRHLFQGYKTENPFHAISKFATSFEFSCKRKNNSSQTQKAGQFEISLTSIESRTTWRGWSEKVGLRTGACKLGRSSLEADNLYRPKGSKDAKFNTRILFVYCYYVFKTFYYICKLLFLQKIWF